MEQHHRDVPDGGVRGGDARRAGRRGGGFGGAGLIAAVAAGCAVTVLATDSSWALRRPEPRPAVQVVAPGAPTASTLPAPATPGITEASTLPAPATPGIAEASTLPAPAAARPSDSDLEVVRLDPDPASPGGTTVIRAFVGNRGPGTTSSPFTVVVTLPKGVTPEGPYFPSDCRVIGHARGHARVVRCAFEPGLREGRSATALVPVRLDPELPTGTLSGGSVEVHSADDPEESNNRQPFDITVAAPAADS
ncbi:hypothetical protein [Kitasatospora brasiliensis]|uniref:hypothetical protein n=1 Tax=Kitasatospora brasiliensis TaxID=3058040 RepID=UPI002930075B|nr:hypothetical protein [Kitasatospora sp. K002]